jgi:hypothetical protein
MSNAELIERLKEYPANQEVMLLDGFNGGGTPRTLNMGPSERVISPRNTHDTSDCEGMEGQVVIVLGYGSY